MLAMLRAPALLTTGGVGPLPVSMTMPMFSVSK
jgi:hypothetical protein